MEGRTTTPLFNPSQIAEHPLRTEIRGFCPFEGNHWQWSSTWETGLTDIGVNFCRTDSTRSWRIGTQKMLSDNQIMPTSFIIVEINSILLILWISVTSANSKDVDVMIRVWEWKVNVMTIHSCVWTTIATLFLLHEYMICENWR